MPLYPFKCPRCGHDTVIRMTIYEYETLEAVFCGNCLQDDVDSSMVRIYTPLAFKFEGGRSSGSRS